MEQLVRYLRHAKESEELTREARQQKNRTLQYFYDHDGSLVIKARLPAQPGALFMKAIDKAADDLWETEPEAVEADTPAGTPNVKFLLARTAAVSRRAGHHHQPTHRRHTLGRWSDGFRHGD